jgi:hypothetical protein
MSKKFTHGGAVASMAFEYTTIATKYADCSQQLTLNVMPMIPGGGGKHDLF